MKAINTRGLRLNPKFRVISVTALTPEEVDEESLSVMWADHQSYVRDPHYEVPLNT